MICVLNNINQLLISPSPLPILHNATTLLKEGQLVAPLFPLWRYYSLRSEFLAWQRKGAGSPSSFPSTGSRPQIVQLARFALNLTIQQLLTNTDLITLISVTLTNLLLIWLHLKMLLISNGTLIMDPPTTWPIIYPISMCELKSILAMSKSVVAMVKVCAFFILVLLLLPSHKHKFWLLSLLPVPQIQKSIISINQFTRDNNVLIEFHPNFLCVKDIPPLTLLFFFLVRGSQWINGTIDWIILPLDCS